MFLEKHRCWFEPGNRRVKASSSGSNRRGSRTKRSVSGSQNDSILESDFGYNFQLILGPVLVQFWTPFGPQRLIFRESFSGSILESIFKRYWSHFGLYFRSILGKKQMRRGNLTFENQWFFIGKTSVFVIGRLPQCRKKEKGWNPKIKQF